MRFFLAALAAICLAPVSADQLKLTNGQSVTGEVLLADKYFVKLKLSDGSEKSFPRQSISQISFGANDALTNSRRPSTPTALNQFQPANGPAQIAKQHPGEAGQNAKSSNGLQPADFVQSMPNSPDAEIRRIESIFGITDSDRQQTPQQVVDALRKAGGVDPAMIQEIKRTFPLLRNPVAEQYFDRTVADLASGRMTLSDLRADAVDARSKLNQLRQFVSPGEQSAMLDRYAAVLDRFIEQSAQQN